MLRLSFCVLEGAHEKKKGEKKNCMEMSTQSPAVAGTEARELQGTDAETGRATRLHRVSEDTGRCAG